MQRLAIGLTLAVLIFCLPSSGASFSGEAGGRIILAPRFDATGWLDLQVDLGDTLVAFATDLSIWPSIELGQGFAIQALWSTGGIDVRADFDVIPVGFPDFGFRLWIWPIDFDLHSPAAAFRFTGVVAGDLFTTLRLPLDPGYQILLRLHASSIPRTENGWFPHAADSVTATAALEMTLTGPLVGSPEFRGSTWLDLTINTSRLASVFTLRFGLVPAGFDALVFTVVADAGRTTLGAQVTVRRAEFGARISIGIPFGRVPPALPLSPPGVVRSNPFVRAR